MKKMFEATAQKETSFFSFKKKLLNWKKEGVAFFEGDISGLTEECSIEFYFHATPSKQSEPKAFPIPSSQFVKLRSETEQYEFLKGYYAAYYPNNAFTIHEFHTYESLPFIGEKFVWYYKK